MRTACECAGPGYCPRHRCEKTGHRHHLCRTRPDYFRLWEEGRGPGQGDQARPPCRHLGGELGERVPCPGCRGRVELKLFACGLHGRCTPLRAAPGVACCAGCPDHQPAG